MNVTPNTKALAQGILDYIETYPERHDQQFWFLDKSKASPRTLSNVVNDGDEFNICKTTMCIAGTAVFLSRPTDEFKRFGDKSYNWVSAGGELLGLDDDEAYWLFYGNNQTAKKMLRAVANGDEAEFYRIHDEDYQRV